MRSIAVTLAFLMSAGSLHAQDSAAVTRPDTGSTTLTRLTKDAVDLGRRSWTLVRRGAEVVFDVDSAVEQWSLRPDQTSAALRAVASITFWLPVAAAAATPTTWIEEAQDGHATNAHYARAATVGLTAGFALSRVAKTLIHRPRPCSGSSADPRAMPPDSAEATKCRGVNDRRSFPLNMQWRCSRSPPRYPSRRNDNRRRTPLVSQSWRFLRLACSASVGFISTNTG